VGFQAAGMDRGVSSLDTLDDGTGPTLYVGGWFRMAGTVHSPLAAKWNGSAFQALNASVGTLGHHLNSFPTDMIAFDDGAGPAIYASMRPGLGGGLPPSGVSRWTGSGWTYVDAADPDHPVRAEAMAVFDDGSGLALFVADGIGAVRKWDGASWTTSLTAPPKFSQISELLVFDDGSGTELFISGTFTSLSGVAAKNIAKWDGSTVTALSSGLATTSGPYAPEGLDLASYDDGTGEKLYVGGHFDLAGGVGAQNVAAWNGTSWSALGAGVTGSLERVEALASHDDGTGAQLYVGGYFTTSGTSSIPTIARWNGSSWSSVGGGLTGIGVGSGPPSSLAPVAALAVFDEGAGDRLFAGGVCQVAGGVGAAYVARWDGAAWSAVVPGDGVPTSGGEGVTSIAVRQDVIGGLELVASGVFSAAGGTAAARIARWNGASWSPLGSGFDAPAKDLAYFADGAGACPNLYAVGQFSTAGGVSASGIARWNGASWSALGSGITGGFSSTVPDARVLAVYDDGSGAELYVGGSFTTAGGLPAQCLARWDGTSWASAGSVGGPGGVLALHAGDIGGGPSLFVAGSFIAVIDPIHGVQSVSNIVRWDGSKFHALGAGIGPSVLALTVYDDGSGPALYAGTGFVAQVRRWDGATWTTLPSLPADVSQVESLAVFDDGSGNGAELYAGVAASSGTSALLCFRGGTWVAPAGGVRSFDTLYQPRGGRVNALQPFAHDSGHRSLFVGGGFEFAGAQASNAIAELLTCATPPGTAFCFGDGSLPTPCPCVPPNTVPNPSGAPDAGCANSFHFGGGKLVAHGSVALDQVELVASGLSPAGFSFFIAASAEDPNGLAVNDGVLCMRGSFVRFGSEFAHCGTIRYPNPPFFTQPLSFFSGTSPGSGVTKRYQVYYRNAQPSFCTSATTNLTNAYRIVW
jgi:hypothetical protein